ncbi:GlcG/HbpS family heme-binding protein [Streptomyces xanthophaeus]
MNATGSPDAKPLPLADALKAAQAAISAAQEAQHHVAVAVVDRNGEVLATLHCDAGPAAPETAKRKAHTAAHFGQPTSALAKAAQGSVQLPDAPGFLFLSGAVPIANGGQPIAGIGVAGAPTGDQDEQYAKVGANALG